MRNRTSDLFFGKAIVRIALSWCDICIHGLHLSLFLNLLESSFPTSFVLNIYRHQSSNLFHLHSPLVWLFLSCLPRLIRRKKKSQKVYKLRFSLLSFHLSFFLSRTRFYPGPGASPRREPPPRMKPLLLLPKPISSGERQEFN